jgi:hypothetical protein
MTASVEKKISLSLFFSVRFLNHQLLHAGAAQRIVAPMTLMIPLLLSMMMTKPLFD